MPRPMKWYKFLIYFSLWLGAALQAARGWRYLSGEIYEGAGPLAEVVYLSFPERVTLDRFYGAALILLGAFYVFTRFMLARFKRSGPACLYLCCGLQAAAGVWHTLAVSADLTADLLTCAVTAIGALIVIAPSWVYFDKRAELFNN